MIDEELTGQIKESLKINKIPLFEDIRIGEKEIEFFFGFNVIVKIPKSIKDKIKGNKEIIDLVVAELNFVKKMDKIVIKRNNGN